MSPRNKWAQLCLAAIGLAILRNGEGRLETRWSYAIKLNAGSVASAVKILQLVTPNSDAAAFDLHQSRFSAGENAAMKVCFPKRRVRREAGRIGLTMALRVPK
jgi:hypothetical protein